jgi:hypothetical protein
VSTTPANIPLIVADISNNPRLTYTLTTQPSLFISQPLDISTNTVGSGSLTVTTNPTPAYNYTLPKGIAGHSTFTINTPVNLIAPTTQFQGYFNADFSFNISYTASPAPASDLCGNQWISVASGGNTSFGLRDGGYLYAWGDNTSGHLGTGDVVDTSKNYPTQVDLSNCIGVACGLNHALALDSSNNAWAWGDNTYGQLGNGGIDTSSNVPIQIYQNPSFIITSISCGDNHSLAIDFSNNLYTWGNNSSSQLGIGSTPDTSRNYPSLVTNPTSSAYWLKAVGASNHSLGLQSDGSLWAWGDNTYGQLGNGTINNSNVPISVTNPLPSNIRWVDIVAGANVSMAITNTNQLYAWGSDISGQIGNSYGGFYFYTTPQLISSPSNFIKCAIGGSHSLGISLNDLYAWGTNTSGQLGIGNTTTQYVPQPVLPPLNPILNTF